MQSAVTAIGETAKKIAYIDLINKLRQLNNKNEE